MRHSVKEILGMGALLLGISACASGGGGGGGTTTFPAPAPVPVAVPAPAPAPAPVNYDTQEYQDQPALARINALLAYEAGLSGDGVIVAIVDSGIDLNNPEFNGRIHPQSADLVIAGVVPAVDVRAIPSLQDNDDHGTPVASIIGAARNGRGVHGVAPEVTLLIFRGDDDSDTDPIIFGEAIGEGAQRAADNGAGVLNYSLGSDEVASRAEFASIFDFTSNSVNDIVAVIAAGNDGNADPQASALGAIDSIGGGTIIAGALNTDNTISSFTNRAGIAADFYLSAPGVLIPTTRVDTPSGSTEFFSGTSAATPHISGAAALVREMWPALTASEVVDILFDSATDLGAPGTDPIFGRGLLNVGAAIQPIGPVTTTSVDGVSAEIGNVGAQLSSAFGASFTALGDIVVFDQYDRDFRTSLGQLVSQAAPDRFELEAVFNPFDDHAYATQKISPILSAHLRLTSRNGAYAAISNNLAASALGISSLGMMGRNDFSENSLAFSLTGAIGGGKTIAISQGFSARAADRMTLASFSAPFLSENAFADGYLPETQRALTGIIQTPLSSNWSADVLFTYGYGADRTGFAQGVSPPFSNLDETLLSDRTVIRSGINYHMARGNIRIEQGIRHEAGSILDAQFGENTQASTFYAVFDGYWRLFPRWRIKGRLAAGYTRANTDGLGGFVEKFSGLTSTQYSLAFVGDNLFSAGDSLWFGVSQPMQITGGVARLLLPAVFDKHAEILSFAPVSTPLGVTGARLDYEASYQFQTTKLGSFHLNLLHQSFGDSDVSAQTTFLIRNGFAF